MLRDQFVSTQRPTVLLSTFCTRRPYLTSLSDQTPFLIILRVRRPLLLFFMRPFHSFLLTIEGYVHSSFEIYVKFRHIVAGNFPKICQSDALKNREIRQMVTKIKNTKFFSRSRERKL